MKQMKMLLVILGVGIMLLCSSQAFATLYDFEGGNLSAWTGKSGGAHHGQLVSDPLESDHALNFTAFGSGGDIFTNDTFTAGDYILSFDYLGLYDELQDQTLDDLGGFIGYSTSFGVSGGNYWLAGTQDVYTDPTTPALVSLSDGTGWGAYSIPFTASASFRIMVEDFVSSGGVAGDAYFDNIELNTAPVPEPATMFLLGFGLLGLAGFRKKLIKS